MKQYIRKADIILFIILIVLGLAITYALSLSRSEGETVVIRSNGELFASYSLDEDRTVKVPVAGVSDKYNIVEIRDGSVSVTEATCSNQVCVETGKISKSGESIVCLPNKLIVRIEGSENQGGGYDSVTS